MKNITVNFSSNDLSKLIPAGSGYYQFTYELLDSNGNLLVNANIPNNTGTQLLAPTGNNFIMKIPVVDAPYNIPNVKVQIWSNANEECCVAIKTFDIINTGGCSASLVLDALQCNGVAVMQLTGLVEPITFSVKSTATGDTELFSSRLGNLLWFLYNPHDIPSATYTIVATGADGCVATATQAMACPLPSVQIEFIPGVCLGTAMTLARGRIFNAVNAVRYQICYDNNFSLCTDNCTSSSGTINQGGDTFIDLTYPDSIGHKIATIRIYASNDCARFTDYTYDLYNSGCSNCPPDGTWTQNSAGKWYKTLSQAPTAVPSGYAIVAKKSKFYAIDGTDIYDPGLASSTRLTTPGMWKATNSTDGPMNRCSVWTNKNDGGLDGGTDLPTGKWLAFSKCLTALTLGKQYFVGLEADNFYRLIVDGEMIFQSTSNATHFRTWKIYPIVAKKTTMLISMEGMNEDRISAFGCQIYDNTKAEIVAATSTAQLNIIYDSISKLGSFFDTGDLSGGVQYGYGCPEGYQYNPCTGNCEKTVYCA